MASWKLVAVLNDNNLTLFSNEPVGTFFFANINDLDEMSKFTQRKSLFDSANKLNMNIYVQNRDESPIEGKYPLQQSPRKDYEKYSRIVHLMVDGDLIIVAYDKPALVSVTKKHIDTDKLKKSGFDTLGFGLDDEPSFYLGDSKTKINDLREFRRKRIREYLYMYGPSHASDIYHSLELPRGSIYNLLRCEMFEQQLDSRWRVK